VFLKPLHKTKANLLKISKTNINKGKAIEIVEDLFFKRWGKMGTGRNAAKLRLIFELNSNSVGCSRKKPTV